MSESTCQHPQYTINSRHQKQRACKVCTFCSLRRWYLGKGELVFIWENLNEIHRTRNEKGMLKLQQSILVAWNITIYLLARVVQGKRERKMEDEALSLPISKNKVTTFQDQGWCYWSLQTTVLFGHSLSDQLNWNYPYILSCNEYPRETATENIYLLHNVIMYGQF